MVSTCNYLFLRLWVLSTYCPCSRPFFVYDLCISISYLHSRRPSWRLGSDLDISLPSVSISNFTLTGTQWLNGGLRSRQRRQEAKMRCSNHYLGLELERSNLEAMMKRVVADECHYLDYQPFLEPIRMPRNCRYPALEASGAETR